MNTFIITISLVFLSILVELIRSAAAAYNKKIDYYKQDYEFRDNNIPEKKNSYIGDWLNAKIRRNKALKAAKRFLTVRGNTYKLQNNFLIIKFDNKAKILTAIDKKNLNNSVTVIWAYQQEAVDNNPNNMFEEFFDTLCISFTQNSGYKKTKEIFIDFFEVADVHEEKPKIIKQDIELEKAENIQKIDINEANTEQLTALPGISAIMAKKIIQYRDLNGCFNSVADFYSIMKIKPHFQIKLNNLILVKENNINKKVNNSERQSSDERIIDF